jgi:hypothetical protein
VVVVVVVVVVRKCLPLHDAWPAKMLSSQMNYTVQMAMIIFPDRNLRLLQPLEEKVI